MAAMFYMLSFLVRFLVFCCDVYDDYDYDDDDDDDIDDEHYYGYYLLHPRAGSMCSRAALQNIKRMAAICYMLFFFVFFYFFQRLR